MSSALNKVTGIDPLKDLLVEVLTRLEALESKVGISSSSSGSTTTNGYHHHHPTTNGSSSCAMNGGSAPAPAKAALSAAGDIAEVKAYDEYIKSCVIPLSESCDALNLSSSTGAKGGGGGGGEKLGKLIQDAFDGIRTIIILASRSKTPDEPLSTVLPKYLTPTTESVTKIRSLKLERKYDWHYKAIVEMLSCLSWILYKPPQQLPVAIIKETLGSAEFWSNRIRKEYKNKDEQQIAFCDNIKKVIVELTKYVETYHKTGLTFNARSSISLAEAALVMSDEPTTTNGIGTTTTKGNNAKDDAMKSPVQKRHPTLGTNVVAGGNVAGLMGELSSRKTSDGTSAATGLRKVTRDQQTWRKEYKKPDGPTASSSSSLMPTASSLMPTAPKLDGESAHSTKTTTNNTKKTPLRGVPIFEYQDRGYKWVIENHTKESANKEASSKGGDNNACGGALLTIDISDPKQQVYLYNCDGITVKVNGKFKSLILDKCTNCAVVYDTLISSAEVVNCKKVQLQVNGLCPVFSIDKTTNILIWLSKESKKVSTFTTSLSSEMNVSFPSDDDDNDQKELPIPEQFVHKFGGPNGTTLSSEVSDLYH